MSLEKLVVVGGISGVHKVAANRSNGLIIEDLDTGKKRFAPSRKHQFTPLESITIYTDDEEETLELSKVFQNMFTKLEEIPLVSHNASNDDMKAYFAAIIPNYDRDRVYIGDMKKMVKWFKFLNDRSLITLEEEKPEEEAAVETEKVEEATPIEKTEEPFKSVDYLDSPTYNSYFNPLRFISLTINLYSRFISPLIAVFSCARLIK